MSSGPLGTLARRVGTAAGTGFIGLLIAAAPASGGFISNQAAQPVLTHVPNPVSATIGTVLKDSATLSGGNNPTTFILFELYDPSGALFSYEKVGITGNGTYTAEAWGPANKVGTWRWHVEYGGDTNNLGARAPDQAVVVTEAVVQPTLTAAATPTIAVVGQNLNATATLSGGNSPRGVIRFTLNDPGNKAAATEQVAVQGNGTYASVTGQIAGSVGTWQWKAEYLGDSNNKPAASKLQPVVVTKAGPVITQTPNLSSTTVGATLADTVNLAGGSNPTGKITFTLYDPYGKAVYTQQANVSGNGSYGSMTGHLARTPGTWYWKATYGGDQNNLSADTDAAAVYVAPAQHVVVADDQAAHQLALIVAGLIAAGLLAPLVVHLWKGHRA